MTRARPGFLPRPPSRDPPHRPPAEGAPRAHRVAAPRRAGGLPARRRRGRLAVRSLGARARGGAGRGREAAGRRGLPADRGAPVAAAPRADRQRAPGSPGRPRAAARHPRYRRPAQEGLLLVGLPDRRRHEALAAVSRRLFRRTVSLPRWLDLPLALAEVPAARVLRLRDLLPDGRGRGRRLPRLALQPRRRRQDALLLRAALVPRPRRPRRASRCCRSRCPTSGAATCARTAPSSGRRRFSRH